MSNVTNLSVVVPCYNEEENIPLIAGRFNEILPKDFTIELVLVDNGSTDATQEAIKKAMYAYSFVRMVVVEHNIGYGHGIMSGLKAACGEFLSWTHADMQTDPADAVTAYRLMLNQKDQKKIFIKGNRKGRSLFDNFFTVSMALFETALLGEWLWEINAQPKLFHRSLLDIVEDPPDDWSLDLFCYYVAKKNNFCIKSVDVKFPERIHGKSHWNTGGLKSKFKFIKRTLEYSFQLKKKLN